MAGTGEPSSVLLIDRISLLRLQIHVKIYFMPFWQLELSFFSLTEQVLDCSIGLGVFSAFGGFLFGFLLFTSTFVSVCCSRSTHCPGVQQPNFIHIQICSGVLLINVKSLQLP